MTTAKTQARISYLRALCRTAPFHIVERVLDDPTEESVQSQGFDGSVMFADLVGFTSFCETLAQQGTTGLSTLARMLDHVFENLLENAVFPYTGYVVHFGGDSITVAFRGSGHAERAAACALTVEKIIRDEISRETQAQNHCLEVRIGLAAGETWLITLGDMTQRRIVCAGHAAHRAVAMQELAAPNSVAVDQVFLRLLDGRADIEEQSGGWGILRGLRDWPKAKAMREWDVQLRDNVGAKIALLEPFVPEALAQRMQTSPEEWRFEGELRSAVIVFGEMLGLEEQVGRIGVSHNLALSLLRVFRKYGGVLTKTDLAVDGHRMMILFGLYRPADSDAERALLACLEANTRFQAFAKETGPSSNRPEGGVSLRLGVHSGQVYFGPIGSVHRHDITVVGDAVNVAARTASAAGPFEVLATDTVLQPLASKFRHVSRPPVAVKGKSRPLQLHLIEGATEGTAHYVTQRSAPRFLAGRTKERQALAREVDGALQGRGRLIGITGEHGTGKSALLSSIIDRWLDSGAIGMVGQCRYATRSSPLAPVSEMFSSFVGITSGEGKRERSTLIQSKLTPMELEHSAPELVALLQPVQRPDGTTETLVDLADSGSREAILSSVLEFIDKKLRKQPLLYILEDLHLADTLTLDLMLRMARRSRDLPFLFVGTYRPTQAVAGLREVVDTEIVLTDLPASAIGDLMKHEFEAQEIDQEFLVFLSERTSGNPGYAVELASFLSKRGMVTVRAGTAIPNVRMQQLEDVVPPTLEQLTLARLEALGSIDRRVVRAASAIGRRFSRFLLRGIVTPELEEEQLESALTSLSENRVIVKSLHEHQGYMFRDAVTRATAYGTIPDDERQRIHRRIAETMEQAPDQASAGGQLAMHYQRAGMYRQAALWYERTAKKAMRVGLFEEVADLCEQWAKAVAKIRPEHKPDPQHCMEVEILHFTAVARQQQPSEILSHGGKLLTQYGTVLDPDSRLAVDFWRGSALILGGQTEEAQDRLECVFDQSMARFFKCNAARLLGESYARAGDGGHANHWIHRAFEAAGDDALMRAHVELLRADLLSAHSQFDEALAIIERVQELAAQRRRLSLVALAFFAKGTSLLRANQCERARTAFHQALGLHSNHRRQHEVATVLVGIGQTYLWEGSPDAARTFVERGLAIASEIGDEVVRGAGLVFLGAVNAWTQDPARGAAMCEEGYRIAQHCKVRETQVAADLQALGIALLRKDSVSTRRALERCKAPDTQMNVPLFTDALAKLEGKAQTFLSLGR